MRKAGVNNHEARLWFQQSILDFSDYFSGESQSPGDGLSQGIAGIRKVNSAAGLRAVRDLIERQIALMQSQLRAITLAEQNTQSRDDVFDAKPE